MEEFLIGAGLALLLALLAWSDQIRNLRRETLELEKDFSQNRHLDLRRIRTIIRTELSPGKRITALNNLVKDSQLKLTEDIDIIEQLSALDSHRHRLENLCKTKYWLVVILTHCFLVSAIVNYFIHDCSSFQVFCLAIKTEFIPIGSCIAFLYVMLCFITHLNRVETKYREDLNNLMDRI